MYTYIYIYIHIANTKRWAFRVPVLCLAAVLVASAGGAGVSGARRAYTVLICFTPNLPTNIVDFRVFDSSIMLI